MAGLQSSEFVLQARLAAIVESSDDAIISKTLDGVITSWNAGAERIFGYSASEMIGAPITRLFPPERLEEEPRILERLKNGERVDHFETVRVAKDGRRLDVSATISPVKDDTGRIIGVSKIIRDITERKQMVRDLRRSEENLAVTLDSMGDAMLATDVAGRITRMNPVAEHLTGWTQAEALGRPIAEVFHIIVEGTREPAVIPVAGVLATGTVHALANHTVIIGRDGAERPISDSAAPIRDKEGRILGVVLVFRDGTEAHLAQQEIRRLNESLEQRVRERTAELERSLEAWRESEERFRLMVESVQDYAILMLDAGGRVVSWNSGAQRMKGYAAEEIIGRHFSNFFPAADVQSGLPEKLLATAAAEGRLQTEGWRVRKDGKQFLAHVVITALFSQTRQLRGFCKVVRDITEHRERERLAFRAQRLESIGTLAAGVAHDLNNAIAPIMMGVEIIKEQYPQKTEIIEVFEASARHAAEMVRQLMTFAKGSEGERLELAPRHLIKEMEKLIQGSFPKNIRLLVRCEPKLPLVIGDATQLHQVLLNLCVNARDAMPEGGTLTLEAQVVEMNANTASLVPGARAGRYVALKVRDTGSGIPPEVLDRIFDPFFTTKGPEKGTGLGLSTVLGIVKGHLGFLHVYSQPGEGSTFCVYLPAGRPGGDTEHFNKPAEEFRGQGETVLIVDDEAGVREVARVILQKLNFKPLIAPDGVAGLIEAVKHRAELAAVITDQHMPHMGGLEFVRSIRRLLPDMAIAVASGHLDDSAAAEFKGVGVVQCLDKPFTQAQLAGVLKTLLTPK